MRYFTVASLAAFVLVVSSMLYLERTESDFFTQVQQEQTAFIAQMQEGFMQRHDAAAPAYLMQVQEAGSGNLTRVLANALWNKDFASFVSKAQRIPVDQCRAMAEVKDAGGNIVSSGEKQACYAGMGKRIMALPEFQPIEAKVFDLMRQSAAFKIKVYDPRGITVYSSEHKQIGEDKIGNAGWKSAMAGKPASELTGRGKISVFEGEVAKRDLISSYVPVSAPGGDKTVAVFEVYSDVAQFLDRLKRTSSEIRELGAAGQVQFERAAIANRDRVEARSNQTHAIVIGLFALLWLTLFLIVRNGQRHIDKQDIARKKAGLALSRQKDLYAVLSQTNKAIIHLVGRDELFAAVCRIAVERGHFLFAWIDLIEENDPQLKPVARYGEDAGYIDHLILSRNSASVSRRVLTGQMLLSGTYVISNDFVNDRAMAPWHEAARRVGVRAMAKFPIRQGGAVIGAINLYAGEPEFFTEDLVATLGEIANDVSFGLDNYAHEAARKQAEEALRAAQDQFRGLVEQSIAGIDIVQDGKFAYVNPRFAEILGYDSAGELIGRDALSIVAETDRSMVAENIRKRIEGEVPSIAYSFTARRKDGAMIDVGVHGARATYRDRPAIIGLMQDISEKKRAEEEIQRHVVLLQNTFMGAVGIATTLSELRDPYTAGHERRVGAIAAAIGAELGFDARRVEGLRVAGHLHDIGKISIPTEILSKPGRLSAAEFTLIKGHAQTSYDILKNVQFPWPVAEVALQHHERIDGSGYPQGLEGETILLEARIMAVADVIEAMSSHRPYRPSFGIEKALAEIERSRGTAFDPVVVDACLNLFREKGYQLPA